MSIYSHYKFSLWWKESTRESQNLSSSKFFFLHFSISFNTKIKKKKQKKLKGKVFWNSLVLYFHYSENLQMLQVDVIVTLRMNHCKFNYCHFEKIRSKCFNPNNTVTSQKIDKNLLLLFVIDLFALVM